MKKVILLSLNIAYSTKTLKAAIPIAQSLVFVSDERRMFYPNNSVSNSFKRFNPSWHASKLSWLSIIRSESKG
jgi:hypothetical protein